MHYLSCCIWTSILRVISDSEVDLSRFLENYESEFYPSCHKRRYRTWKDMYEINSLYIFWDPVTWRRLYVYLIMLTFRVLLLFLPSGDGLLIWPVTSFYTAGQKCPTDLDLHNIHNLSSRTMCTLKPYKRYVGLFFILERLFSIRENSHIFSGVLRINKYNQLQISSIYVPYFFLFFVKTSYLASWFDKPPKYSYTNFTL